VAEIKISASLVGDDQSMTFTTSRSLATEKSIRCTLDVAVSPDTTIITGDASGGGGYIMAKNVGTNTILLLRAGSAPQIQLEAGDFALFRLYTGSVWVARAVTSPSELEYLLFPA